MATLNINGQSVNVDDSFLQLSPADQSSTVDSIASSMGAKAAPAPVVRPVPQGAELGPNGLMWTKDAQGNPTAGYDPQTGELVMGGKPMGAPPSQLLAASTGVLE